MNIYLDIETVPDGAPDYSGLPDPASIVVGRDDPSIEVNRRLKDPAKIEADIEKKRARVQKLRRADAVKARAKVEEEFRKGSFSATRGRVLCVGIAVDEGGPKVLMEDTEEATLALLQKGLQHYASKSRGRLRLWTWNGGRFDRPFIARRALRYQLYPLAGMMRVEKPWLADDLYQVWGMGDQRAGGKLDDVCDLLGIARDDNPCTGAAVYDLFQAGDLDTIRDHCLDDIRVLQLVAREFTKAGWLE